MHTPVDCIDHNLKISAFATNHVSPPLGMERGGLASELDVDEKANFTVQEELRSLEKAKAPSITGVNIVRQVAIDGNRYAEQNPSISLRKWLSNPNRVIDIVENIHIFKQIAEFVELAHSQGVVLRNIRPSSFLLSSLNRVSIIESASSGSTSSSSRSSEESTGRDAMIGGTPAGNEPTGSDIRKGKRESQQELTDNKPQRESFISQANIACEIEVTYTDKQESTDVNVTNEENGKAITEDIVNSYRGITEATSQFHEKYEKDEGDKTSTSCSDRSCNVKGVKFPLKQILSMELIWYKSPEELSGMTAGFSSDIYSLGVLFFELFFSYESEGEWSNAMSDLRHRLLPPKFLFEHPKEASFCLLLLHPNPNERPGAREILHADVFSDIEDKLVEREAIMTLEKEVMETEVTLDFLLQMQQEKHITTQKLVQELQILNNDIKEVGMWQVCLRKSQLHDEIFQHVANKGGTDIVNKQSTQKVNVYSGKGSLDTREDHLHKKSTQVTRNFSNLKEIYIAMINRSGHSHAPCSSYVGQDAKVQRLCLEKPNTPRVVNRVNNSKAEQSSSEDHLGVFFEDLCNFIRYSRFEVKATLQYGDILSTKNMVCSLSFDCDDDFFATAGVCRRIKIFECNGLLDESDGMHYPVFEMTSRRKLSCVCWSKFHRNHLASSDLAGAIHLWDVTAGKSIKAFEEHNKCAWSVDFCHSNPLRLASGSDDCSVKLWSMNQGSSIGTIKTKANICSVKFSEEYCNLLAFGSADSQVYCYDLRHIRVPLCTLTGHQKAVSFIRFVDSKTIVSASTDNTLKLWDFTRMTTKAPRASTSVGSRNDCVKTFTGHTNLKNFVGLSVVEGGYIACGSETNEVFVYHKSLPMSMLSHKFGYVDPFSGQELDDNGGQFVSSVCWKRKSQILVAANSVGNINVLEMV